MAAMMLMSALSGGVTVLFVLSLLGSPSRDEQDEQHYWQAGDDRR